MGRADADEAAWERTAWAVAHLLNVSGKTVKSPVTVDKLLRPPPEPPMDFDRETALRKLKQRMRDIEAQEAEEAKAQGE